ncbi:hypothetical protein Tco_1280766, partial [Tanacetum coccineum]
VEAYEADKILLDTYGDTITIKRPRDGAYDDQEPSVGTDRGSKRRRSRKEPASTSAPSETTTKTAGKTTSTGSKTHKKSASQSAPERIKRTKRRKNNQKPTRNERDKKKSEETAKDQSRISPTQQERQWSNIELMKGNLKSLTELIFCEEVYKATTEKLDWINPEGRQYPHDLRQPLPLRTYSNGRRNLVPNSMWSQTIVKYDKFALWGVSHWGKKRRQFYAFATLRESARDVYSKRRIIAVTKVEIVEWHDYKHLDWITVRRDDDVLYKFNKGDFHRLRIQDIEDMLLLLVQGKVTNLSVEERIAFNVSLRMFYTKKLSSASVERSSTGVLKVIKKET